MSGAGRTQEPSMDDIIRSIRNIIADDAMAAGPMPAKPAAPAAVYRLSEQQIAAPAPAPAPAPAASSTPVASLAEIMAAGAAAAGRATAAPVAKPADAVAPVAATPVMKAALTPGSAPAAAPKQPAAPQALSAEVADSAIDGEFAAAQDAAFDFDAGVDDFASASALADDDMAEFAEDAATLDAEPEAEAAIADDDIGFAPVAAEDPFEDIPAAPAAAPEDEFAAVTADAFAAADNEPLVAAADDDEVSADSFDTGDAAFADAAMASEEMAAEPMAEAPVDEPAAIAPQPVVAAEAATVTAVASAASHALSGRDAAPAPQPVENRSEGGRTLEDSVREMLRPMIREWLDANMPRILERAIIEEIDKK